MDLSGKAKEKQQGELYTVYKRNQPQNFYIEISSLFASGQLTPRLFGKGIFSKSADRP